MVRIGHKVAVGEEQKLDQRDRLASLNSLSEFMSAILTYFSILLRLARHATYCTKPISRITIAKVHLNRRETPCRIIPFDQREGSIWFNGEIVPWKDAKIHVLTHGLHYGSSRVRGRARLCRQDFQDHANIRSRFQQIGRNHGFRPPHSVDANSMPPRPRWWS